MKKVYGLYRQLLGILPTQARRFLTVYSTALASLSILDAASLGLLAAVIGPLSTGSDVVLPFFGKLSLTGVMVAIVVICLLMILKGLLSTIILFWGTRGTAKYEIAIGDRLFMAYLRAPWLERTKRNSSDVLRFTDSAVDASINSFLRPGATLPAEVASLVAIIVTLAVVQPTIAAATLIYLLILGAFLYLWIATRARKAGQVNLAAAIRTSRLVLETMASMKEITIRGQEAAVAGVVHASRSRSARARANIYFLGQMPRYVLESGIVGGFLVVGGVGLLIGGPEAAVAAVAMFGLAGFRMAPSITRVQAILSQMQTAAPFVEKVVDETASVEASVARATSPLPQRELPERINALTVSDLSFRYAPDAEPAVENVSLSIPMGSFVAFVGSSGSGKSTMVDIILSLLTPTEGSIAIDGISLAESSDSWRKRVAYVPQDVALFDASIAQNVALTWDDDVDRDRVRDALRQAQLLTVVDGREGGIDASVGERGVALSGGQRQRLGIARALYTNPDVLVLDEATSALDTRTEAAVTDAITELSRTRTVIVVAHRLATVQHADQIFVMDHGKLIGAGTFAELVKTVPVFADQARLAGLADNAAGA